jgi:hypothetical protein
MAAKRKAKAKNPAKRPAKKVAKRPANNAARSVARSAAKKLVSKVTPLLMVREIEPCIPFWTRIGFEQTVSVPEGNKIGFVILVKDGYEIMYQTVASIAADVPAAASAPMGGSFLFIEVTDLDGVAKNVAGAPVVFTRRKTFYGMEEIGVREPGGNAVTFAQPV